MGHGGKREGAGRPKKRQDLNPRAIEEMKSKIKTHWLLKRLEEHIRSSEGVMVPSAVTAAAVLLRKVMPDLAQVEHSGDIGTKPPELMAEDELTRSLERAARIVAGEGSAPPDPTKLN